MTSKFRLALVLLKILNTSSFSKNLRKEACLCWLFDGCKQSTMKQPVLKISKRKNPNVSNGKVLSTHSKIVLFNLSIADQKSCKTSAAAQQCILISFYCISTFIFLTHRKMSEALYIGQTINPTYFTDIKIFLSG